jgi:hypothetical protein
MQAIQNTLSFSELANGKSVRVTHINNKPYISITDFIMVMTGKDNHDAARTWRTMTDAQKAELNKFIQEFQFPGTYFYLI